MALESDAQQAMNDIAKENANITNRAREGLAKRIAAIESDGEDAIKRLLRESEDHTAKRIALIQEEYRAKEIALEENYKHNAESLRGKIFHDVLYGRT